MNFQAPQLATFPPLKSPDRKGLQNRLEVGLIKLELLASIPIDPLPIDHQTLPRLQEGKSHAIERRAFPRWPGCSRVIVCRCSNEEVKTPQQIEWRLHSSPLRGRLANLGLDGAGLILPHELPTGEAIVVRLNCLPRDANLDQHATVVESQPDGEGHYRISCQFANRLTLDQVALFTRFLDSPRWI